MVRSAAGVHLIPWAVNFSQEAKMLQTALRSSLPLLSYMLDTLCLCTVFGGRAWMLTGHRNPGFSGLW